MLEAKQLKVLNSIWMLMSLILMIRKRISYSLYMRIPLMKKRDSSLISLRLVSIERSLEF